MAKKPEKQGRGGARPGAGRPPAFDESTQRVELRLPASLVGQIDRAAQREQITRAAWIARAAREML